MAQSAEAGAPSSRGFASLAIPSTFTRFLQFAPTMSFTMPPYTIVMRSEVFHLSEEQLTFDSPNIFTSAFFSGDWQESDSKSMTVDRSATIFRLITEYLHGYEILPIDTHNCPKGMSIKSATANLYKDALYYGLDNLISLLEPKPAPVPIAAPLTLLPPLDFSNERWTGSTAQLTGPIPLRDLQIKLPSAESTDKGFVTKAEVPKAVVFSAENVHVKLVIECHLGLITSHWSFLEAENYDRLQALMPNSPISKTTGCVQGSINKQILLNHGHYSCNFDALLNHAAHGVARQDAPSDQIEHSPLDTLFGQFFKLPAAEVPITISFVCERLLFCLFYGGPDAQLGGPYVAPLHMQTLSMADYYARLST